MKLFLIKTKSHACAVTSARLPIIRLNRLKDIGESHYRSNLHFYSYSRCIKIESRIKWNVSIGDIVIAISQYDKTPLSIPTDTMPYATKILAKLSPMSSSMDGNFDDHHITNPSNPKHHLDLDHGWWFGSFLGGIERILGSILHLWVWHRRRNQCWFWSFGEC